MRKLLVLTSAFLFTAGMAVAQDSNQSTMSSTQQPTVDSNNLRGCLTAGGDQFKLTTDIGAKVVKLNVEKSAASPYVAHEVEVQGMTTPDGNFRVDRILDIADHCGHSGQPTTADSGAKAATDSNAPASSQSASAVAPSSTTSDTSASTSSTTAPATSTTNPDQPAVASNPTPSTDTTAQPSTTTSSTMSAQNQSAVAAPPAQPAPDSSAAATEQKPMDQKPVDTTASTSTQSSTTTTTATEQKPADQNAVAAQSSTTTTSEQSAAAAPADQNAKSELPQTGSPLPLLGLLGLGSVAAGLVSRKRK